MTNWIKNRLLERTSVDGAVLVGVAALIYGAWTMWKSE